MKWGEPVAGNYDIGALAGVIKPAELDRLSVKFVRQPDGTVVGAVGDKERGGAVRQQMPRRQLAHLPRTHQVDALAVQAPEDFLRQFDGHRSNRNRRRSDGGFGADALGHGKRPREQLIQLRAHGSNRAGAWRRLP
jgi:hypothetical protein